MSRPTLAIHDERMLVLYLLGLLPQEETERLDEASIVDDDVAARLTDAETDLIDAYVTGALAGELRRRFEAVYLSSNRNRTRVEAARRFRAAIDSATPDRAAPRLAFVRPLLAAAATVIVASGVLLFQERHGLRWPLQREPQAESATIAGPSAATTLSPQVRAVSEVPTITLAAGSRELAIDLRLESNDFSQYQVALMDPPNHNAVWLSLPLTAVRRGAASFVSVRIPQSLLSSQHYSFELAGVDASGRRTAIGSYAVQIERR